jgi:hypothetical protein
MRVFSTILARGACALAIGVLLAGGAEALAAPLSSAFTYQGELFEDGAPLNGTVDLRFTPYADGSNPTLLGPAVVVEDLLVSAGVFTARIDFGPGFFVGDAVFLEVAVRPADLTDPAAFEVLTPRQEITATPYTLKPAPGSVTDLELAGDAVGSPQIADGSIASGDVADNSLVPGDLALAGGAFDATFWRIGGNAGTGGVLGVLDPAQSLDLYGPLGVTINGGRANGNTELTVRGNPNAVETNADLTLWPRGGEAFFNFGVIGQTPADARLQVHAVGTNPFTGFDAVLQLGFDGSLGIGGANPAPHARLHVSRVDLGFDAPADSSEALELVLEDSDAQLGLYSSNGGAAGSTIALAEMNAGAVVNQWGLYRRTTPSNGALQWSFGSNNAATANPVLFQFGTGGGVALGANAALVSDSFVFADGSAATTVTPNASGQFLIRAVGGVGINAPAFAHEELSIGPSGGGANPDSTNLSFGAAGAGQFRFIAGPSGAADDIGNLQITNTNGSFTNSQLFYIYSQGGVRRLGLFRGRADGVYVAPAHPIHVGDPVIANSGNGAHLTSGGAWTNGSSRAFKHAFTPVDAREVLDRVLGLAVTRWRYRNAEDGWHLGPVAEEFAAAFGLGQDEQYIGTVDADGVALAAIQGLAAREDARVESLSRENAELRESLAALARRVRALEQGE